MRCLRVAEVYVRKVERGKMAEDSLRRKAGDIGHKSKIAAPAKDTAIFIDTNLLG